MWKTVIVDDDPRVLGGLRSSIPWEQLDLELVGESIDGMQGLELVRNCSPDIILTDIYMPVLNGLEMIEQLRSEHYSGKIVILSGYSDFQYARHALRLSVDDYLSKPVTIQTMQDVLRRVVAQLEEETRESLERENLEHKLKLYEPHVAKEWMKSVVAGTVNPNLAMVSPADVWSAEWERKRHLVIVIQTQRLQASEPDRPPAAWNENRFILIERLKELLAECWPDSDYIELHSRHAAVVLRFEPGHTRVEAMEKARELGNRFLHCMGAFPEFTMRVGIGTLKDHWERIGESTEEAFLAISSKRLAPWSKAELVEYGESIAGQRAVTGNRKLVGHIKFCQQIAEALQHTQASLVTEHVGEFRKALKGLELSADDLFLIATEIWGILTYTLYDVGIFLDEMFPDMDLMQELGGLASSDGLMDWLQEKVEVVCGNRQWNENLKHRQAIEFMIQYVHEHYADSITIQDLAGELFISRYYLGQLFKKATGDSFNQYLTKVRIAKSKAMILEGKYLIYEIAEKVGFRNVPYFSTLFKKHTGLNPTDLIK